MMEQPVEHCADRGNVGQQFAPIIHGTVRSQQRAGAFVAPHHDLQQIFGSCLRQLSHAEVIDDQQRHAGDRFHILLACALLGGFGDFFQQDMRLAVEHFVALQDRGLADGLRQMAFARATRARNIMPIVPRSSRFITPFIHFTVRAFALNGERSSRKASTFSASWLTARLADSRRGLPTLRRAPTLPLGLQ